MNKTFYVPTMAAVLCLTAAPTGFAAANPFSDVPLDSWAYDAVAQLSGDGVINGYGDGTFRGQQPVTRYEMAQIIAKAMARQNVSAADKAMLDKLSAEFSDELKNLGVRIDDLEKKTDNLKWSGEVWYEYASERHDNTDIGPSKISANRIILRLEPTMTINGHWEAKARIEHALDANSGMNTTYGTAEDPYNSSYTRVTRVYAEGTYDNLNIKLGRLPYTTANDGGMVLDDQLTGIQLNFGKELQASLTAGRHSLSPDHAAADLEPDYAGSTSSYQGLELNYSHGRLHTGAAYHHFGMKDFQSHDFNVGQGYNADALNIWSIGGDYQFTPGFKLSAAYAKNTQGDLDERYRKSYMVQASYKEADPAVRGSFGVYAAYRYLTAASAVVPTYDTLLSNGNQKGWDLGASYTFAANMVGTIEYFTGKDLHSTGDTNASKVFGKMEFFF